MRRGDRDRYPSHTPAHPTRAFVDALVDVQFTVGSDLQNLHRRVEFQQAVEGRIAYDQVG
ncbi:MAG: hypothetical protein H7240_05950 [Glaciimonas sp.]|nr:hypothetical protein [Glaciimonas sp.]